jgi:hypothetical protein
MGPEGKIRFVGWTLAALWGYATVATVLQLTGLLVAGPDSRAAWFLLGMMIVGLVITFTATLFSYRYQAGLKGSVRYATLSFRILLVACGVIIFSLTWRATIGQVLLTSLMLLVWVLPHGAAYYLVRQHPYLFRK